MAAKKKTKKKKTRSNRAARKKATTTKKLSKEARILERKSAKAKKKTSQKKAVVKTKAVGKKTIGAKTVSDLKKRVRYKSQTVNTVTIPPERPGASSGGQSGDLQGLSGTERADSESVDELIEEGNAFEADAVAGVESAGNNDEEEVRTREVPEDDVPGEYLDKE
jgi:hypothetical protein